MLEGQAFLGQVRLIKRHSPPMPGLVTSAIAPAQLAPQPPPPPPPDPPPPPRWPRRPAGLPLRVQPARIQPGRYPALPFAQTPLTYPPVRPPVGGGELEEEPLWPGIPSEIVPLDLRSYSTPMTTGQQGYPSATPSTTRMRGSSADDAPCPTCASGGFGFKSPPPSIVPPGEDARQGVRRISRGAGFFGA